MLNNFFTTYINTDTPPLISEEYQKVKDTEQNYSSIVDYLEGMQQYYGNKIEDWLPEFTPFIPNQPTNTQTASNNTDIVNKTQVTKTPEIKSHKDYVSIMYSPLKEALDKYGIDSNVWTPVLLAHTSIESGWGNKFSRENNNFGGIKGKGSVKVNTKEWSPEKGYYTIKDTFKSYNSVNDFADDYVKRLKYQFKAFEGTPEDYLKNIRKYGYFTAKLEDYQKMMNDRLKRIYNLL